MADTFRKKVREASPLVHCITNYVTANDCANLLLAAGASPIMSDSPDEVGDVVSLCGALVINTGTLSRDRLSAMLIAGKRANALGIPTVLDPAGAGSSEYRTNAVKTLLEQVKFSVIRANFSELSVISGESSPKRGVDADAAAEATREALKALANKYKTVIAATGGMDVITDGNAVYVCAGGDPIMKRVTGTGCMLSALTGAYLAVSESAFGAAGAACGDMRLCAEAAAARMKEGDGNASFRSRLIDSFYMK